jgi:hypothetical protein
MLEFCKKNSLTNISCLGPFKFLLHFYFLFSAAQRESHRNIGYVVLFVLPLLRDGRFMSSRDTIRLQMYSLLYINRFTPLPPSPPPPQHTLPYPHSDVRQLIIHSAILKMKGNFLRRLAFAQASF